MEKEFEEVIINNWVDHFHCASDCIKVSGTTLLPDEKYAGQKMIVLWRIGQHTFIQFDPALKKLLDGIVRFFPTATPLSGNQIKRNITTEKILYHDIGIVHYLFPGEFVGFTPPSTYHIQELSTSDNEKLSSLYGHCTPEEVDEGFVEIDHEIVLGCFQNGELVAAASGYRMAGFMDIGVITHNQFRMLGLGKGVVSALCQWSIGQEIISQYRCNVNNAGSLGVAKSLHFRQYYTSESIKLEK